MAQPVVGEMEMHSVANFAFKTVKHRNYVASLILHASIAEITAQLLSLSYVYLISSDDSEIFMIFCAD